MRFDPKKCSESAKDIRKFEHPILGTIEYVLPTIGEQLNLAKLPEEDGVKGLLFLMLAPCSPDLLLSDIDNLDSVTFQHLSAFIATALNFRAEIKN